VDPALFVAVILFSLLGAALGCGTGAAPGIHVNTLCLLLTSSLGAMLPLAAAAAAWLGADAANAPVLLACLIVSAAASHSFLDFLPSIFLGAPDEGDSLSTLPGHRLLLQGRGLEAVRHAADGALVGGSVAAALCVPLYFVLGPPLDLYPFVDSLSLPVVLLALALLVLSEKGGEVRAEIKVARAARSCRPLSLARPVPVHGDPVVMRGRAERRRGMWLVTPTGRWRLRGPVPEGEVEVEGIWQVRTHPLRNRLAAVAIALLSGLLGLVVMDRRLPGEAFVGLDLSLMFPLLTGLFGVPSLLSSGTASLPPQRETRPQPRTGLSVLGALAGAAVGWFPGITSTTGVVVASSLARRSGSDAGGFIAMVSAVGTASAVFGLLALAVAFKGRSGALLAVKEVLGGDALPFEQFPLLLTGVLVGCAVGDLVLLRLGARFARSASVANVPRLNRMILVLLVVLVIAFTGVPGMLVLGASTLLGMVPLAVGVGRVHLTGCLLVPVLLFLLDVRDAVSAAL